MWPAAGQIVTKDFEILPYVFITQINTRVLQDCSEFVL